MRFHEQIIRPNSTLVVLGTILGVLWGCAVVGPTSISMGRADYNEAINKTDDAQMLMSIVRGRYGETFSLLAVTGVAANVSFGTNAGSMSGSAPMRTTPATWSRSAAALPTRRTPPLPMRRFKASGISDSF